MSSLGIMAVRQIGLTIKHILRLFALGGKAAQQASRHIAPAIAHSIDFSRLKRYIVSVASGLCLLLSSCSTVDVRSSVCSFVVPNQ